MHPPNADLSAPDAAIATVLLLPSAACVDNQPLAMCRRMTKRSKTICHRWHQQKSIVTFNAHHHDCPDDIAAHQIVRDSGRSPCVDNRSTTSKVTMSNQSMASIDPTPLLQHTRIVRRTSQIQRSSSITGLLHHRRITTWTARQCRMHQTSLAEHSSATSN